MKQFAISIGFAMIIGTIYAGLQYHSDKSLRPDILIPEDLNRKKESITLNVNDNIYKGKRNWLLSMLNSADKIFNAKSKDKALSDVVDTALSIKDYNMAIVAAEKIDYSTTRDSKLVKIVSVASIDKDGRGFAVLAAEKISYLNTRNEAFRTIIDAAK